MSSFQALLGTPSALLLGDSKSDAQQRLLHIARTLRFALRTHHLGAIEVASPVVDGGSKGFGVVSRTQREKDMSGYDVGTNVKWKWGGGWGSGTIDERFTTKVTRTINGTEVTRNATSASPAYLIKQSDGDRVLKSHSEIEKAN